MDNSGNIYDDAERRLLDIWFAGKPTDEAAVAWLAAEGFEEPPSRPYKVIDAWVGSFAVRHIQDRLPNCGISYREGEIILTRTRRKVRSQKVMGLVRHLFGINWADSGPGFSWPADYNLVWFPGYERFVLTYSADSPDALGYCDLAIGSIAPSADWKESVHQLLVADWGKQWWFNEQAPWQALLAAGSVSEEEALRWRKEAWRGHEMFPEPEEEWPQEQEGGR